MSHESNAATLRGCAEESNLDIPVLQVFGIVLHCIPCLLADRHFEVVDIGQADMEGRVDFYQATEANLQDREVLWSEKSAGIFSMLSREAREDADKRTGHICGPLTPPARRDSCATRIWIPVVRR